MIRSSALYISLIVSLIILLICGALLLLGFTYRMYERKQERLIRLERNLESGTELVLLNSFKSDTTVRMNLFGNAGGVADSVLLEKRTWGVYQMARLQAWQGADTLSKSFLMGSPLPDTLTVLYLADEDRPVSISGNSKITGTAYLPKSGIRAAYVESSAYTDGRLVYGRIAESGRDLPEQDAKAWKELDSWISTAQLSNARQEMHEKHKNIRQGKYIKELIVADSLISVAAGVDMRHVILIAPYIRLEEGFKGSLQAFATDSIIVSKNVKLDYPSALVLLKQDTAGFQPRIAIGETSVVQGQVMAYEKKRSEQMPIVELQAGAAVIGEVWVRGYLSLAKSSTVNGMASAIRLFCKTGGSIYENYLIDAQLNRPMLSKHYLSNHLIQPITIKNQILCWLN